MQFSNLLSLQVSQNLGENFFAFPPLWQMVRRNFWQDKIGRHSKWEDFANLASTQTIDFLMPRSCFRSWWRPVFLGNKVWGILKLRTFWGNTLSISKFISSQILSVWNSIAASCASLWDGQAWRIFHAHRRAADTIDTVLGDHIQGNWSRWVLGVNLDSNVDPDSIRIWNGHWGSFLLGLAAIDVEVNHTMKEYERSVSIRRNHKKLRIDRSMYVDRCRDCFIFPLRRCGNRPGQEFAAAGCGLMSRASTPFTTPRGLRFFDVFWRWRV